MGTPRWSFVTGYYCATYPDLWWSAKSRCAVCRYAWPSSFSLFTEVCCAKECKLCQQIDHDHKISISAMCLSYDPPKSCHILQVWQTCCACLEPIQWASLISCCSIIHLYVTVWTSRSTTLCVSLDISIYWMGFSVIIRQTFSICWFVQLVADNNLISVKVISILTRF
jgi:hypothetical protein